MDWTGLKCVLLMMSVVPNETPISVLAQELAHAPNKFFFLSEE
jgi:hypothetical protein